MSTAKHTAIRRAAAAAYRETSPATLKSARDALRSVMGYLSECCREDQSADEHGNAPLTAQAQAEYNRCEAALRALGG